MTISENGEYRRSEYQFERQQSLEMRARAWEERLPPVKGYLASIVNGLGIALAIACLFAAMLVFQ